MLRAGDGQAHRTEVKCARDGWRGFLKGSIGISVACVVLAGFTALFGMLAG